MYNSMQGVLNNRTLVRPVGFGGLASILFLMSVTIPFTHSAATPPCPPSQDIYFKPHLTVQHWQDSKLDQYLRTYPNGTVLNLPEYIQHLSLPTPFECGVGKSMNCHAPPYVSLQTPDWYILSAVSHWNQYTNGLVTALSSSFHLAKDVVHQTLRDLVYQYNPEKTAGLFTEVDLIKVILYPIEHGGSRDHIVSDKTGIPDWEAAISPVATEPAMKLLQSSQLAKSQKNKRHLAAGSPSPFSEPLVLVVYNSSQPVETNLHQLKPQFHNILVASIENKINSPISLETGIYSALEYGRFASPRIEMPRLASNARDIMRLASVSALLNSQNAMILVKRSSCSLFRNQMKDEDTRLRFCASDSTLIEIVRVEDNTIIKDIYNAHIIKRKYGFHTSFLASESMRCYESRQTIGGQSDTDDYEASPYDVCTFGLPICNLEDPKYEALLRQGKSVVEICREDIGLAI